MPMKISIPSSRGPVTCPIYYLESFKITGRIYSTRNKAGLYGVKADIITVGCTKNKQKI